jgi:glucose/arabinose dehydrogenase
MFARLVALVGAGAILVRRQNADALEPAYGSSPAIPTARPQGIPTLKMPAAKGWATGQTPKAAAGRRVNAFATGLKHPRWIHVLPNGDALASCRGIERSGADQDCV